MTGINPIYLALLPSVFISTIILDKILKYYSMVDMPAKLKIHKKPTSKAIGICISFFFIIYGFYIFNFKLFEVDSDIPNFFFLFYSFIIFFLMSIIDDFYGLNQFIRLFLQITLVFFSLTTLPQTYLNFYELPFLEIYLPPKLTIAIVIYIWIFLINENNFIDGIDANCGIKIFFISIGYLFLNKFYEFNLYMNDICIFLIVIAPLIILFNKTNKFKSFLGDSGAIPIGLIMGWLGIVTILNGFFLEFLLLNSIYIFDVLITVSLKIFKRENIFVRHNDFVFFKIFKLFGHDTHKSNFLYIVFNLLHLILLICLYYGIINSHIIYLYMLLIFISFLYIGLKTSYQKNLS